MNTYWTARSFLVRGLGALYFLAASIVLLQLRPLIGPAGVSPLPTSGVSAWDYPSLLFLFPFEETFIFLGILMGLASLMMLAGLVNWPLLILLYILQVSLVNGGGIFYGFGWETMMCEITFTCLFVTHPWRLKINHEKYLFPSKINFSIFWLLLFKLMFGAGLIKIRGDSCWTDFSCMDSHYETQPNPHFLSWYLHNLPHWFHRFEVGFNHFIELFVPFGLLLTRKFRLGAGLLIGFFQIVLIGSGNLAFINWQTLVLTVSTFDDAFLRNLRLFFFPKGRESSKEQVPARSRTPWEKYFSIFALALVLILSLPVFRNLLSPKQSMNESYSRLHLVNSYGLFGSITKERYEIVFLGTKDTVLSPATQWKEYQFYCKPGAVDRRPCWITPYHLRLDWQLWFSAMRPELSERYLSALAEMMLRNDTSLEDLWIENPFRGEAAPKFIKMDLYRYHFTSWDEGNNNWWRREYVKPYLAPASFP